MLVSADGHERWRRLQQQQQQQQQRRQLVYPTAPHIPFSHHAVAAALTGSPTDAQSPVAWLRPAPPPPAHPNNIRELYADTGANTHGDERGLLLPGRAGTERATFAQRMRKRVDVFSFLDFDCRTGTRAAGCVLLLMFLVFVGCICALLVVVVVRVDTILDTVDVRPLTLQMHGAVATAWNASVNMHTFTHELRDTLAEMRAPLLHSVNTTDEMVDSIKSFAKRPALSFSVQPGALLGGGGGTDG